MNNEFLEILGLCAALTAGGKMTDNYWHDAPLSVGEESRHRIWWRVPFPQDVEDEGGPSFFYMSAQDAEFRADPPPDDPEVEIRNAPVPDRPGAPSGRLEIMINRIEKEGRVQEPVTAGLYQIAKNVLSWLHCPEQGKVASLAMLHDALAMAPQKHLTGEMIQGILCGKYLWTMMMPQDLFAEATLMTSVQLRTGLFIPLDGFESAHDAWSAYRHGVPGGFPSLVPHITCCANWHYEQGNKRLVAALQECSQVAFNVQLLAANHHFMTALLGSCFLKDYSRDLVYSIDKSDEGFACSSQGLSYNIQEMVEQRPPAFERHVAYNLLHGTPESMEDLVRSVTSVRCPCISRPYARFVVAEMILLYGKEEWQKEGLARMRKSEEEYFDALPHGSSRDSEINAIIEVIAGGSAWTDLAAIIERIITAYKMANRAEDAARCGKRIAAINVGRAVAATVMEGRRL